MRAAAWIAVVALAAIAGFLAGQRHDASSSPTAGETIGDDVLYWVAPMDPDYRRDRPGKSPMGMDLVPVYASDARAEGAVSVTPEVRQSLGVRTAAVTRAPFARQLDAVGYTRWDESTVTMLHARAEGWLQTFNVASVGDRVSEGQTLYELFSPKLVSAQQEFLSALASGNASLTRASRDRLRALGLDMRQIGELERRRAVVEALSRRADRDATVIAMDVREGTYVMPATHVLTLAGLQTIWVEVDVYERDIGMVRPGLPAAATFDAYPGEVWHGRIGFVYPELDEDTRTLRVRLTFDNADERLRPNMMARVRLTGSTRDGVLQMPAEAALRASGGTRVLVDQGDGRFGVQPVRLGARSGAQVEVLDGLTAGQRVVTSGQFLLDAEANGAQALARLTAPDSTAGDAGSATMHHTAGPSGPANRHSGDGHAASMHGQKPPHGDAHPRDASATDSHDHMQHHTETPVESGAHDHASHHGAAVDAPVGIRATARIIEVAGPRELRVSHDPIAELGWPAMTMNFEVADAVTLNDWAAGDSVTLTLEQGADDRYRVVAIDGAAPPATMDAQ